MSWSRQQTMNTTRERWIVEWNRHDPQGKRSRVSTGFSNRAHLRRQLAKLQSDSNVRSMWVTRVVPVVRWTRGCGTASEQLDAFPIDEVPPVRWNMVCVTKSYSGPPGMPGGTWFRKRESLRQRVSELQDADYVTQIYVTHVADVLHWHQGADDAVGQFDTFVQKSMVPEPPQLERNVQVVLRPSRT